MLQLKNNIKMQDHDTIIGKLGVVITTVLTYISFSEVQEYVKLFTGIGAGCAGFFTAWYYWRKDKREHKKYKNGKL